jgi:hypothetical protein
MVGDGERMNLPKEIFFGRDLPVSPRIALQLVQIRQDLVFLSFVHSCDLPGDVLLDPLIVPKVFHLLLRIQQHQRLDARQPTEFHRMNRPMPVVPFVFPPWIEREVDIGDEKEGLDPSDSVCDGLLVRASGRDEEGGKFVRVSLGDESIGSRRSVEEADPVLPSGDRDRSPEEREAELPASEDGRSSQRDQCTAIRG